MSDNSHIAELLGEQPTIDESQLPDSGTTDADLEGPGDLVPTDEHGEMPPAQKPRVPLSALQEERQRRQELQEQLRQQSEFNQKMQERFQQMMERMQQPQQPEQQAPQEPEITIPDFNDDPAAHMEGLRRLNERMWQQQQQFNQQLLQQFQVQQQQQSVASRALAEEAEFRKTTADYDQAAQFFTSRKAAEYAALGASPAEIQQQLQRDFLNLAVVAQQRGKSAPAMMYELSKAMGYSGQQPAGQQQQPAGQQVPGKPVPTSLSNMGGAPQSPEEQRGVTLESVANMTDAEFDKFWKDMERGSRQRPRI